MSDKALYFPYIRVPESAWFTRVLLYWDRVGSIVPSEFLYEPDRLGAYMVELVRADLVEQVIPGMHIYDIPRFAESFLEYVDAEASRRGWLQWPRRSPAAAWEEIHAEKMEHIAEELIRRGLARHKAQSPSWYAVEPRTAAAFMAYLAAVLGQRPELNFVPITDHESALAPFSAKGRSLFRSARESNLQGIRATILSGVLPAPADPIPPPELVDFKSRYHKQLVTFRNKVETLAGELSSIPDETDRTQGTERALKSLKDDIEDVANRMKLKWSRIVFGSLFAIPPAFLQAIVPGPAAIAGALGLIAAIHNVVEPFQQRSEELRKPVAFAALVQEKFRR